jgi:hypothetical protein
LLRQGVLIATVIGGTVFLGVGIASTPSVWIENLSSQDAVVFVTDNSTRPEAWYVVPAGVRGHAGSAGLGSSEVRVNVLGWGAAANGVGRCSPGDYDDTVHDVPRWSSVRLLIDKDGTPIVSVAPEPPDLPVLRPAPLNNLPEADRC